MALVIGGRTVGPGEPCFIVGEAGLNHDGSLGKALEMVHAAKAAGSDAFKVQCFAASCFTTARAVWNGESQAEMFRRYELPREAFGRIAEECRRVGLAFFGTPDCPEHARWLVDAGAAALKVGSDDLTNTPLIRYLSTLGLPLILSTGMAETEEVWAARFEALSSGAPGLAILYCCSVYPASMSDLRLREIGRWAETDVAGFSDHTIGSTAAVAAVALGASIVEKHFTLDNEAAGPDHEWSADPEEFLAMVASIRQVESALTRVPMEPAELAMRVTARRSIVAARALPVGHVITTADLAYKRPGDGLPPSAMDRVLGRRLAIALEPDELVALEDLC